MCFFISSYFLKNVTKFLLYEGRKWYSLHGSSLANISSSYMIVEIRLVRVGEGALLLWGCFCYVTLFIDKTHLHFFMGITNDMEEGHNNRNSVWLYVCTLNAHEKLFLGQNVYLDCFHRSKLLLLYLLRVCSTLVDPKRRLPQYKVRNCWSLISLLIGSIIVYMGFPPLSL